MITYSGQNGFQVINMYFSGFQKLTLLDYPGKIACLLFTSGCNFRCPFCHNASLVTHIDNNIFYSDNEILEYLKKRKGILEGVCISGGEPLLHKELIVFIKKVKELGFPVKLDTNGSKPDELNTLINNKLIDYVAMDIKNSREKYSLTTGVENIDLSQIEKSIDILLSSDIEYEFRTTIVNEYHTLEDIESIGKLISGAKRYFLQNFIDSGDLIGNNMSAVETTVIKNMQKTASKYVQNVEVRGL